MSSHACHRYRRVVPQVSSNLLAIEWRLPASDLSPRYHGSQWTCLFHCGYILILLASTEIRLLIWRLATMVSEGDVYVNDEATNNSTLDVKITAPPNTTQINSESREEALKSLFRWTIPGHRNKHPVLINFPRYNFDFPLDHLEPRFFRASYGLLSKKVDSIHTMTARMRSPCHFAHQQNPECPINKIDGPVKETLGKCEQLQKLVLEYEPSIDRLGVNKVNVEWVGNRATVAKGDLDEFFEEKSTQQRRRHRKLMYRVCSQKCKSRSIPKIFIICTDPGKKRNGRRLTSDWRSRVQGGCSDRIPDQHSDMIHVEDALSWSC